MIDLGGDAAARAIQKAAAAAHASQSQALPELICRVDLLGGGEQLRWLVPRTRDWQTLRAPWLAPGTGLGSTDPQGSVIGLSDVPG